MPWPASRFRVKGEIFFLCRKIELLLNPIDYLAHMHMHEYNHLRWHGDFMIDCLVDRQTAQVYSELKQCKEAFELEKNAHKVYSMYLGENHETTKSCQNSLLVSIHFITEFHLCAHPSTR